METQQETPVVQSPLPAPVVIPGDLPGIKALLQEAWGRFTSRFTDLIKLEVVVWVPLIVGAFLMASFVLPAVQSGLQEGAQASLPQLSGGVKAIMGVAWALMVIGGVLRVAVSSAQVKILVSTSEFSVSEAWRHGWKRFFPVIGHGLLLALIFLPLLIALLVPVIGTAALGFLALSGQASELSQAIQTGVMVSGILCVVLIPVYVFLSVKLGFVLILVGIGETTGAFKESWNITKGKFWAVLWRIVVGSVLVGIVSSVITGVLDMFLPGAAEVTRGAAITGAGINMVSGIIQFIIMLFAAAYSVSLLRNLQGKTQV